jgi:surfactin synthase thioesterase subunit
MTAALVPLTAPEQPSLHVIAIPGAGAGPSTFEPWRKVVPQTWRLSAVCLPGRGNRFGEPFATDMRVLAKEIAAEIATDVPLLVFGHSMGALVALEVAALVRPRGLVVAGCAPPASRRRQAYGSTAEADVAAAIRDVVASLGVPDPDLFEELVALSTPVLLADLALLDDYRPQSTMVDCDLLALYGTDDDLEPEPWHASTSAASEVMLFPGGHFFLQHDAADVIRELAHRQQPAVATGGPPIAMTPEVP